MVQPLPPVAPVVPPPTISAAQAAQLTQLLADAGFAQGLRHDGAAAPQMGGNEAVVRAALDYARAVHSGRLDTSDFQADWGLRPAAYDPIPAFADAVKRDRIAAWFRSLPPPYAGYDGLQKGLANYRKIEAAGGWSTLPAGPDLAVGSTGARVTALRKRLAVEDSDVATTGATFDAELKEAVVRAQRRYGLNPTGLVSTQTLAALNVPAGDRVRQIMANMERWRWLPAELPAKRIQVNIAAAVLTVFEGDAPIASMKAVTGRPGNETPMLQSRIHSIVLNPPWNVPAGIAAKELFPKGAAYLAANNYKIIGTGAGRRIQQQPGPKSALGLYKFDFDNPYAVYLHDTPAQAKFASFNRLDSHGCVRLEKPGPLAELLLRNDPAWQPDAIEAAKDKGKTLRVQLQPQDQVHVYLLYWTAFASANGQMNFRGDPYGWDKTLAAKIERRSAITAVAAR
ncbi:L,D-transpeptidase family protein [Sphingomonas sp. HF-S4]|uniref:L,D-transpeptidase family protein n=2 Tax=Sphingomonas agrestis TaxID=3080540 RepID=A0ABU3Y6D8_9SPHN|nr:L,D-transpeptidase family protein [Sphingomonas sp. HF-S4]MDV3456945.1 L,D-transpeptidase family protein [Sphingomonas sp. HF-S4]